MSVLFIGGIDNSCGAGIFRDVMTASKLGTECSAVIGCLMAQNDINITGFEFVGQEIFLNQLKCGLKHDTKVVKIGMVGHLEGLEVLHEFLIKYCSGMKIVLDTPLIASSGTKLFAGGERKYLQGIIKLLIPYAEIITPNYDEAKIIYRHINSNEDFNEKNLASKILHLGAKNLVIKGGHRPNHYADEIVDIMYWMNDKHSSLHREQSEVKLHEGLCEKRLISKKIKDFEKLRGTGCTFTTLIACAIDSNMNTLEAVTFAKSKLVKIINPHKT